MSYEISTGVQYKDRIEIVPLKEIKKLHRSLKGIDINVVRKT